LEEAFFFGLFLVEVFFLLLPFLAPAFPFGDFLAEAEREVDRDLERDFDLEAERVFDLLFDAERDRDFDFDLEADLEPVFFLEEVFFFLEATLFFLEEERDLDAPFFFLTGCWTLTTRTSCFRCNTKCVGMTSWVS